MNPALVQNRKFEPGTVFGGFPEDPTILLAADQHPCPNLFDIIRDGIVYRTVEGWPQYRIGEDGTGWGRRNSRSECRVGWHWWRQLKPGRHSSGYQQFQFYDNYKRKPMFVHRLVLEAFVGPCPEGMEACHNDGDCTNNRLENLRWDTRLSNIHDKQAHGTQLRGSGLHNSKLEESDIPIIVGLVKSGISRKKVAERFNVTVGSIDLIVNGKTWTHVPR